MNEQVYTAAFPFGGCGGGALGFLNASITMLGTRASFRLTGGVDFDPVACRDFEYLTGVPETCADVDHMTPADFRKAMGERAPDVIFMSPPCKGSSKLLSGELAKTEKYQAMNRLAGTFIRKMFLAWPEPPRLVIFENVPNITTRAADVIEEVTGLLEAAGYAVDASFHECGEIGGLAQKRKRFLLVARHKKRATQVLYSPPKKRIRGCGEVLGTLPIPGFGGGPMHVMPLVSWLTWVRLALIPAGGDWRDLEGVLKEGQARRTVFRRHRVEKWSDPSCTIGGPGSNGPTAVSDPRVDQWFRGTYGVLDYAKPAGTITGNARPGTGAFSVADPRINCTPRAGTYGVLHWTEAAATITAAMQIDNGKAAVADPRVQRAYDHGYAVLHWEEPSPTVAAGSHPGQGAYSVADPRGGHGLPFEVPQDPRKAPSTPPIIIAEDGTWHRPLTVLELAALQGFPTTVRDEPLKLYGSATGWREHIGNAVPPPTAQAIAEKMLVTLLASDAGSFVLDGGGSIWVEAPDMLEPGYARYVHTHHQEAAWERSYTAATAS